MLSLFKDWYRRHFSQPGTVEFALVLVGVFILVYYFMWLVGPLVVAVVLAYCLDYWVVSLKKYAKLSRHVASIVVMTAFTGLAVLLFVLIIPQFVRQGSQMYDSLVMMSQEVVAEHPLQDEDTTVNTDLDTIVANNIYRIVTDLPDPIPAMVEETDIFNAVHTIRTQLTVHILSLVRTQLMPSVVNIFTYLMYIIIVPVFTFLMLYNKGVLLSRVGKYLLPNNQILMKHFWPGVSRQIEGYIRGKAIHVVVITVVNTAAFQIFSLNYAILLGVGVGLSVIVPYVGAVLIAIPVVVVALLQFGLTTTLFWLFVVYLVIQLLDSNVLTPMLFSKAMNLDAFSILAAILIFGGLWGFWGVFLAIPLATFVKTLIVGWPSLDKIQDDLKAEEPVINNNELRAEGPDLKTDPSSHDVLDEDLKILSDKVCQGTPLGSEDRKNLLKGEKP